MIFAYKTNPQIYHGGLIVLIFNPAQVDSHPFAFGVWVPELWESQAMLQEPFAVLNCFPALSYCTRGAVVFNTRFACCLLMHTVAFGPR